VARFGDGLATDADLVAAAERAARQAIEPLAGRTPDLACVFVCGSDDVESAGLRAAELTGARQVIGCTGTGVIGAGRGVEGTSAVAVWAGVLPGVRIRTFHLEVMRADEGFAVVGLPERTDADAVVILLADPYSFPVDGFVAQSNSALRGLPFVGGLASGSGGAGSARLFVDDRVVGRGAVGAVLGGPVGARSLVSQGCRPVGPEMIVTSADANAILELAGMPALTKLESIVAGLGVVEQALVSEGLQLGVVIDEYAENHERGDFLVRGIVGADRDRQALLVADLVEVGRTVRFQVRDADSADEDLRELLAGFRADPSFDTVEGALLFSCNGRGARLFPTADHDVELVRRGLATSGVGGFFAAGEIGPVGGRNYLHGFTASVLAFGSGPTAARGTGG